MSDELQHINVDDEQWDGTPRALREHVDKLQKALKVAGQTITGFETERASTALSGVLTGYKNPERVKSDILRDKVDPLDSEAVTKWLEGNGDDYARASADPALDDQEGDPDSERAAARERLNAFQQFGRPGTADPAALVKSTPTDLNPANTREWIIQNVPGA